MASTEHDAAIGLLGELIDENMTYSLRELCIRHRTHAEDIVEMVAFGIVEPVTGQAPGDWRFDCTTLLRVGKALRLQQDLRINLEGIAVALELLDEVAALRREVEALRSSLERFHYSD